VRKKNALKLLLSAAMIPAVHGYATWIIKNEPKRVVSRYMV
jgi:hypothetical protein